MKEIKKVLLQYNLEDDLNLRYGHKLRGFFSNKFEHILFHNHKKDGGYRYAYPLIQYKIIDGKPIVVGLGKGADLIIQNFMDIDRITFGDKEYVNPESRLDVKNVSLQENISTDLIKYRFISPWIGLNQHNHSKYLNEIKYLDENSKNEFLTRIITGNILTFAKGIDWWIKEKVIVKPKLKTVDVKFKNKDMLGFVGAFETNLVLPNDIGLGKSVSRGFGTIKRR